MTFLEAWIEFDYNPFIVFDENGRVKSLNQEAQYLLGEVTPKEIFELAKSYATHSFGFKTTVLDLNYGLYSFYAITVGYQNEDEIGIKLYKRTAKKFSYIQEYGKITNIYSILDLCISAASAGNNTIYKKEFDPTFPEIRIKVEEFTKLLNKIYQSYQNSKTITSKLMLNIGEYIKFNNKKYPIFSLHVSGDLRDKSYESSIKGIAKEANTLIIFKDKTTILSSALVSS